MERRLAGIAWPPHAGAHHHHRLADPANCTSTLDRLHVDEHDQEFEAETGIKVTIDTYDSNETALAS